jgi:hypothetical protein
VKAGEYRLTDTTYAHLVEMLAKRIQDGSVIPKPLAADVKAFYADRAAPIETKKHRKRWTRLLLALDRINSAG